MYRGNSYFEALKLKYLAEIAEAEAVLGTYFEKLGRYWRTFRTTTRV